MLKDTTYKLILPENSFITRGEIYFGFQWNYCNSPKNGIITVEDKYWKHCRDGGIGDMRDDILSGELETDRTRMIFCWLLSNRNRAKDIEKAEAWMRRGMNTLHLFEKLAGWALTRVYRLNVEDKKGYYLYPFYFLSSRRWIKSSFLAYLYVMIVRMSKDEFWGAHKSFDGMKKACLKRLESKKTFVSDHGYIVNSLPYWEALFRGYPQLFEKKKLNYYWEPGRFQNDGGYGEGIDRLVRGATTYTGLYKQLTTLKEKFEKEAKTK